MDYFCIYLTPSQFILAKFIGLCTNVPLRKISKSQKANTYVFAGYFYSLFCKSYTLHPLQQCMGVSISPKPHQ